MPNLMLHAFEICFSPGTKSGVLRYVHTIKGIPIAKIEWPIQKTNINSIV